MGTIQPKKVKINLKSQFPISSLRKHLYSTPWSFPTESLNMLGRGKRGRKRPSTVSCSVPREKQVWNCPNCPAVYQSSNGYHNHWMRQHGPDSPDWSADAFNSKFISSFFFVVHFASFHPSFGTPSDLFAFLPIAITQRYSFCFIIYSHGEGAGGASTFT